MIRPGCLGDAQGYLWYPPNTGYHLESYPTESQQVSSGRCTGRCWVTKSQKVEHSSECSEFLLGHPLFKLFEIMFWNSGLLLACRPLWTFMLRELPNPLKIPLPTFSQTPRDRRETNRTQQIHQTKDVMFLRQNESWCWKISSPLKPITLLSLLYYILYLLLLLLIRWGYLASIFFFCENEPLWFAHHQKGNN